ncbi:cathepsin O isoform X2 [Tachyglossus aculeatus]|uniref:cathepsin O isoform X2 n=1 Tax=Tachyglossus aculeatus TaxID=9261 RepID=UPI0018F6896F|nr:cathepsin O isoform X2 [Tachyglossus aculeatus]
MAAAWPGLWWLRRLGPLLCCCCCLPSTNCTGPSRHRTQDRPATIASQRAPTSNHTAAFRESLRRHIRLNSLSLHDNTTASYGTNQFSHLFPEEFKAIYLRSKTSKLPRYSESQETSIKPMPLPIRFDWRDKHVVTQVRNQEATQVKLVKDSEYSFKAQTGMCHYFSGSHYGISIKGYSAYDFSGQEDEMAKVLLSFGPLAVIVDAVSWQDYLGGIIQHHCSSGEANHAVLITGYDKSGSIPYWIVRNSWGSSWGVNGYAHVKMGANICGIADSVSAVLV